MFVLLVVFTVQSTSISAPYLELTGAPNVDTSVITERVHTSAVHHIITTYNKHSFQRICTVVARGSEDGYASESLQQLS